MATDTAHNPTQGRSASSAVFTRYALYYTPPDGPLARFGAQWLGWDIARGAAVAQPDAADLDVASITATPRRYGFHATIKPPFRLAERTDVDRLKGAVQRLGQTLVPVDAGDLALTQMGRFLALVPRGDATALIALAAEVVTGLDQFRAAPTYEELARRRAAHLSPRQQENSRRWGYPHVMQDFRFHMTLTGALDRMTAARATQILHPILTRLLPHPCVIDSLTLVGERPDGMFVALERFALSG